MPEPVSPKIPNVCPGPTVKETCDRISVPRSSEKAKETSSKVTVPLIRSCSSAAVIGIRASVSSMSRILTQAAEKRCTSLMSQPLMRIGIFSIQRNPLKATRSPMDISPRMTYRPPSTKAIAFSVPANPSSQGR